MWITGHIEDFKPFGIYDEYIYNGYISVVKSFTYLITFNINKLSLKVIK